jgi:hypothetical protein
MMSADPSGLLQQLHDGLVALGLKTKLPPNSETLLFEVITQKKERVGWLLFEPAIQKFYLFHGHTGSSTPGSLARRWHRLNTCTMLIPTDLFPAASIL